MLQLLACQGLSNAGCMQRALHAVQFIGEPALEQRNFWQARLAPVDQAVSSCLICRLTAAGVLCSSRALIAPAKPASSYWNEPMKMLAALGQRR